MCRWCRWTSEHVVADCYRLQEEGRCDRDDGDGNHHVHPRVNGARCAYYLVHVLKTDRTPVCAIDVVDTVRDTRVDFAMGQRSIYKEREKAELAGDWLEESWVVKAQAAREEYPLHITKTVGHTR